MTEREIPKAVGGRIQQLRKQFGYTREVLAEKIGISWQHLGNIEKGSRGTSVQLLMQFSKIFNVSIDYIVTGVTKETQNDLESIMSFLSAVDPAAFPFVEEAVFLVLKAYSQCSEKE